MEGSEIGHAQKTLPRLMTTAASLKQKPRQMETSSAEFFEDACHPGGAVIVKEDDDYVKTLKEEDDYVEIKLRLPDQKIQRFYMCRTTPLSAVVEVCAQWRGLQTPQLRLMADGIQIELKQTWSELDLGTEDVIEVLMEQSGGGRPQQEGKGQNMSRPKALAICDAQAKANNSQTLLVRKAAAIVGTTKAGNPTGTSC